MLTSLTIILDHLFHWLITPVFFMGGESLLTVHLAEYLSFGLFFLLIFSCYLVAKRVYGVPEAVVSVVIFLCLPEMMKKSIQIRPDVLSVIFILFSVYFHISILRNPKLLYAGLAGLFLALSFFVSQKAGFFAATIGVFHLYLLMRRRIAFRHLFFCWGVFSFVVLSGVAWLYYIGALNKYYETFLTMANWNEQFSPLVHFDGSSITRLGKAFFFGVMSVFFLHGLFRRNSIGKEEKALVSLCALTGIIMLFLIKVPYMHNFLYFTPFFSMIAASSMFQIFRVRKQIFHSLLCLFILAFVFQSTLAAFYPFHKLEGKSSRESLIEYSLSVTDSDDLIYDGDFAFNIFRKNLDYLWYGVADTIPAYVKVTGYNYDVHDLIEKRKPKVISDAGIDMTDHRIANHYELVKGYPELSKRSYRLYVRKDERVE